MNAHARIAAERSVMLGATARTPGKPVGELPEILCGRYQIERLLGVGGMGAVYRARDLLREQFGEPQPWLALKTLSTDFAEHPDANALLHSEFALNARLSHRYLLRCYSFEVDPTCQRAFITMELLKGNTLDHVLQQYPSGLPWAEAQPLAISLLQALQHVHERGVLHGDLKPGNLMLGDDGLRLFDFGLGQARDGFHPGLPHLAHSRFAAWTPRYAAPELLDGAALSTATDLYGAACVIYELCSGQHPFQPTGPQSKLPPAPTDLPRAQWLALRKALATDPAQRDSLADLYNIFRLGQPGTSRLARLLRRW